MAPNSWEYSSLAGAPSSSIRRAAIAVFAIATRCGKTSESISTSAAWNRTLHVGSTDGFPAELPIWPAFGGIGYYANRTLDFLGRQCRKGWV